MVYDTVPIQKLLAIEVNAVEERIAKGKEVPTDFDEGILILY